jgi:hypothetical protein
VAAFRVRLAGVPAQPKWVWACESPEGAVFAEGEAGTAVLTAPALLPGIQPAVIRVHPLDRPDEAATTTVILDPEAPADGEVPVETKAEAPPVEAAAPNSLPLAPFSLTAADPPGCKLVLARLALCAPAVLGSQAAIATRRGDGGENLLGILDWEAFAQGEPCLRGAVSLAYPAAQVSWLAPDALLVGGGSGAFTWFVIPPGPQRGPQSKRVLRGVHTDAVCGFKANPKDPAEFLSGSQDGSIRLVDFARGPLMSCHWDVPVSSVAWPTWNQGLCPSVTLDPGGLIVFDTRRAWDAPACEVQVGRPGLRSHLRYTDHHVVMGFEDGELLHLDLRRGGSGGLLGQIRDPKTGAASQMVYDESTGCMLVGGSDDFTLWQPQKGFTVPAGHGLAGPARHVSAQAYGTGVAFASGGRFLVTPSTGQLAAYQLNLESQGVTQVETKEAGGR